MTMRISARVCELAESETMAMARRSAELRAKGCDVISLGLGEPDFDAPDFIKDAAKLAIDGDFSHYTPVSGYLDLREAICVKLKRDNGLDFKPDQIVVSTGAKQSIANVVLSLVNPGDEVILLAPYWVTYPELVKLAGGKTVAVSSRLEDGFRSSADAVISAITARTKLIVFNSPCNPTGAVYDRDLMRGIAEAIAEKPGICVISDEIYEHFVYGCRHASLASFDCLRDRVITVNGVSKGFAVPGWRIGYIAAPRELAQACEKFQGQLTSAPCSIAQKAAKAAMDADPAVIGVMRETFRKRRDALVQALRGVPGVKTCVPDGAFYVFPDFSHYYGKTAGPARIGGSSDMCMYLLNEAHVALVPGMPFGEDRCLRFSYAAPEESLLDAVDRIKNTLGRLK